MEANEERAEREQGLWKLYGWLQSLGSLYVHGTQTQRCTAAVRAVVWESSLGRGEIRLQSSVKEALEREVLLLNIASHPMVLCELGGRKCPQDPSVTGCRQPGLPQIVHYFFCASFLLAWSFVVLLFVVYCVSLVSCLPNQIHSSYFLSCSFWLNE